VAQHSDRPARRKAAHSKTAGHQPGYRAVGQAGRGAGPDWSYFSDDHPSWPVGSERPDWPQPGTDYPSWPANANQPDWPGDGDQQSWFEGAADPRGPAGATDPYWSYPGADHPSWPAGAGGADWPQPGADYPSWPAGAPGGGWAPERGGSAWQRQEAPVVQHHDERWQAARPPAPVASAPVPATRSGYPAKRYAGAHAKTWSAKLARTQDAAPQTYYELAFGDGRLQVMLTEPPTAEGGWTTSRHARPVGVLQLGSEQAAPVVEEDLRNSDSLRVAERILSDADYQAAEIRREAAGQATEIREAAEQEAAEIRQQAADRAAPVREAADREAADVRQQAAGQATEIREAAEREAAAIRAAAQQDADALRSAIESMSAELSRMASVLDGALTAPRTAPPNGAPLAGMSAATATAPAAPPQEAEPAGSTGAADYAGPGSYAPPGARPQREAGKPAARPGRRPLDEPSAVPDDFAGPGDTPSPGGSAATRGRVASTAAPAGLRKPPGKPGAQTRQYVAAKRFAIGAAGLVTFGLLLGAFNLVTYHSLSFFVFRGQGVGSTPPSPLPAQPNGTPSAAAHHHAAVSGHKQLEPKGRHHRRPAHDQSAHGGNHG
jgi:hypothetical protein